jgi:hypothetical protein
LLILTISTIPFAAADWPSWEKMTLIEKIELAERLEYYYLAAERIGEIIKETVAITSPDNGMLDFLHCDLCWYSVSAADYLVSTKIFQSVGETAASLVCGIFLSFDDCYGFTHEAGHVIILNMVDFMLGPAYVCENMLNVCSQTTYKLLNATDYINLMLSDKPAHIQNNTFINDLYK